MSKLKVAQELINIFYPVGSVYMSTNIDSNLSTSYTCGNQGHTHTYMPPYFEVYMWYRTA